MARPTDDAHESFGKALKHIETAGHHLALSPASGKVDDQHTADLELARGFWDLTVELQSLTVGLRARVSHQEASKKRDEAAAKMTPAQIAEAQRMAREWKPK